MVQDMDTLWAVQQCLTQYLKYAEDAAGGLDILDISFQSLGEDPGREIVNARVLFDQQSLLGDNPASSSFRAAVENAYLGELLPFRRPA